MQPNPVFERLDFCIPINGRSFILFWYTFYWLCLRFHSKRKLIWWNLNNVLQSNRGINLRCEKYKLKALRFTYFNWFAKWQTRGVWRQEIMQWHCVNVLRNMMCTPLNWTACLQSFRICACLPVLYSSNSVVFTRNCIKYYALWPCSKG